MAEIVDSYVRVDGSDPPDIYIGYRYADGTVSEKYVGAAPPSGAWSYRDPETGVTFEIDATSWHKVRAKNWDGR